MENIRRNEELMRELDVLGGSKTVGAPKRPVAAPKPAKRSAPVARAKKEPIVATRSSARLKGHVADSESLKRKIEEEEEEARAAQEEAKRARHEVHDLKALTGDSLGADELEDLRMSLRSARTLKGAEAEPKTEFTAETKELSQLMNRMQLRSVSKVTPARIYSALFHPTTDKDLIFLGDKEGGIGVWDASAETDEAEDVMPAGKAWTLRAHGKSPVTCLKIDPVSSNTLYSASYDATVRYLDLESSTSHEIWAENDETLLSIFDVLAPETHASSFTPTPAPGLDARSLWIADHRGGLIHLDLREQKVKSKARRWQVCEKKVRQNIGLARGRRPGH